MRSGRDLLVDEAFRKKFARIWIIGCGQERALEFSRGRPESRD